MNFYLIQIIQGIILTSIMIAAFLLIKSKDLFISVIYFSIISLMLAAEFYILQAPDVAIAEAAIGASLSSAIYIVAIYKTNRFEK